MFAKEKCEDSFILSESITVTELPTVLNDWGVFPGAITIIGISAANILFTGKVKIIISFIIFLSTSINPDATANFAL